MNIHKYNATVAVISINDCILNFLAFRLKENLSTKKITHSEQMGQRKEALFSLRLWLWSWRWYLTRLIKCFSKHNKSWEPKRFLTCSKLCGWKEMWGMVQDLICRRESSLLVVNHNSSIKMRELDKARSCQLTSHAPCSKTKLLHVVCHPSKNKCLFHCWWTEKKKEGKAEVFYTEHGLGRGGED